MTDEREQRHERKEINFLRMYGASEIKIGRTIGQYPPPDDLVVGMPFSDIERRVVDLYVKPQPVKAKLSNYLAQLARGRASHVDLHEKLLAAGARWDGMDGYDVTAVPDAE